MNQQSLIIIMVLLAVAYFILNQGQSNNKNNGQMKNQVNLGALGNYQNNWINQGFGAGYGDMNPASSLPKLIEMFGPPSVFDGRSGGQAVWYKKDLAGTPFERIELRDEQIPHDKPAKHTDFLYTYYKIDIPGYKIGGLHKISDSISYDSLKKLMVARCYTMAPNVVSHWIVKQYADGERTIDEVVGMYGPMIMELLKDDPNHLKYKQLLSEL